MSLADKIKDVYAFLAEQLKAYDRPVLYCSFGKDSLVLLHLLIAGNIWIPVIYHRDPFFPRKNWFADQIINLWNLETWDYPPARVSLCTGKEMVALVSEYQNGQESYTFVLKNTQEFRDGDNPAEFLCGVNFLKRPCGSFAYPWNAALVAHKSCDTDPIFGPIPLHSQVVFKDQGPDYVFPLRDWTHDDIWDYTEQYQVPYQADRYDLANRCEWPDKKLNSDYYQVCVRCVDKRLAGQEVYCPKLNKTLANVSAAAPEFNQMPNYFSYSTQKVYEPPKG